MTSRAESLKRLKDSVLLRLASTVRYRSRLRSGRISRFLFSKNDYRPSDNTVKPGAFLPPEGKTRTSVVKSERLSDQQLLDMGMEQAIARKRNYHGRTDLDVANTISGEMFKKNSMWIELNHITFLLHSDICGWPLAIDDKDIQMNVALEMTEIAQLHLT